MEEEKERPRDLQEEDRRQRKEHRPAGKTKAKVTHIKNNKEEQEAADGHNWPQDQETEKKTKIQTNECKEEQCREARQRAAGTQETYLNAGSTPSVTASSKIEMAEGSKAMSLACCCASSANWVWPGDVYAPCTMHLVNKLVKLMMSVCLPSFTSVSN